MSSNWYAVYTMPQRERKVSTNLTKKGIENYCPVNYIERQKANIRRGAFEPLFSCYVFVHISEAEIASVRNVPGVINLIYWKSKPAIISNEEISTLKQLTSAYMNIKLEKSVVNMEDTVHFLDEPVISYKENSVLVKYQRLKVILPSLGYTIIAERERGVATQEVIEAEFNQFALLPRKLSALFTN